MGREKGNRRRRMSRRKRRSNHKEAEEQQEGRYNDMPAVPAASAFLSMRNRLQIFVERPATAIL
jgi:hypothetical protein